MTMMQASSTPTLMMMLASTPAMPMMQVTLAMNNTFIPTPSAVGTSMIKAPLTSEKTVVELDHSIHDVSIKGFTINYNMSSYEIIKNAYSNPLNRKTSGTESVTGELYQPLRDGTLNFSLTSFVFVPYNTNCVPALKNYVAGKPAGKSLADKVRQVNDEKCAKLMRLHAMPRCVIDPMKEDDLLMMSDHFPSGRYFVTFNRTLPLEVIVDTNDPTMYPGLVHIVVG